MGLTFRTKAGKVIPENCTRCNGQGKLGTLKMVNGQLQAAYFCQRCGARGESIRVCELEDQNIDIGNLPLLQDNTGETDTGLQRRSIWDERKDLECEKCPDEVMTLVRVSVSGFYKLGWACPGCGQFIKYVADEWAEIDVTTVALRPVYADFRRSRMSYDEYLEDPWWKRVSWAAKWLSQGRCQLCGTTTHYTGTDWLGLHTHHNDYSRRGHEAPSDLIVLCSDCHSRFHKDDP